jgi:hypothetical protein
VSHAPPFEAPADYAGTVIDWCGSTGSGPEELVDFTVPLSVRQGSEFERAVRGEMTNRASANSWNWSPESPSNKPGAADLPTSCLQT